VTPKKCGYDLYKGYIFLEKMAPKSPYLVGGGKKKKELKSPYLDHSL
jgi:hypothetical protein